MGINSGFYFAFALLVLVFIPKLILISFMFGEDIFRFFEGFFNTIFQKIIQLTVLLMGEENLLVRLHLELQQFLLSILYGITKGKYNYKVLKYTLFYDDLPEEFNGYKISQISDIHSGSFDNKEKVEYGVKLINDQKSDVIMFTGDLVNSRTSELTHGNLPFLN